MINAATLAFLNAPMEGIICAVAVGRRVGAELVVDPLEEEEVEATGCFAFLVTRHLDHQGTTPPNCKRRKTLRIGSMRWI